MVFQADCVRVGSRAQEVNRQINLTYNAASGLNNPFTITSNRPYPDWGSVLMRFSDARSNYNALETGFTKRMSHHWQASATYTLAYYKDLNPLPVNPGCSDPMTAP